MDKYEAAAQRFEKIPDGEAAQICKIAELTTKLIARRYPDGKPLLRGVHPKAHGCVAATFQIAPDLPEAYRVGVFAKPGENYESIVRFSNAAALVSPDIAVDGGKVVNGSRGMAIKVKGIQSAVMQDDEPETQDFLMVNFPVFPFANVADYLDLTEALLSENDDSKKAFAKFAQAVAAREQAGALRVKTAAVVSGTIQSIPVASPLESEYFGAAPFLFGTDRVMKFFVRPVDATRSEFPTAPVHDDYLRQALVKQIGAKAYEFDFYVQLRGPDDLSIEDVTVEWNRPQKVARLTIPQQDIDSAEKGQSCENLFFTPWHCLPEHRPLGGINRLRKAVYLASFNKRRKDVDTPC